jgi:signal transduction histidine kinase
MKVLLGLLIAVGMIAAVVIGVDVFEVQDWLPGRSDPRTRYARKLRENGNQSKSVYNSEMLDDRDLGDFKGFRRQEVLIGLLNLLLIVVLLGTHVFWRFGGSEPSVYVVVILTAGFAVEILELVWLWRKIEPLPDNARRLLTFWSIGFNTALAVLLTAITQGDDSAYYALMILPILQAAFRLGIAATAAIVVLAGCVSFFAALGMDLNEYMEAGAASTTYVIVGIMVWRLVNDLREREARLLYNFEELERTRSRLLSEEKLAAVGRLSTAIAHEIRNPVAMISSSLATATRPGQNQEERTEMFGIAAKEAKRLEQLTTDFLAYARPRAPRVCRSSVADTLNYVAGVARAHAAKDGIAIQVAAEAGLQADFDAPQMQQALLNLVLNAIEVCTPGNAVKLNAETDGDGMIRIDVIDPVGPIAAETVERIFEPLFTTKPYGTGLGLAIARNIARAQGGDIELRTNEPGTVCFSMTIPQKVET